jgi:hypothetical protein
VKGFGWSTLRGGGGGCGFSCGGLRVVCGCAKSFVGGFGVFSLILFATLCFKGHPSRVSPSLAPVLFMVRSSKTVFWISSRAGSFIITEVALEFF